MWFQAISDLKVNLGKSELVPVGEVLDVKALDVKALDSILEMQGNSTSHEVLGSSLRIHFQKQWLFGMVF